MTCYFLLFWFILTLHDRTGRLEKWSERLRCFALHDRTGRLENLLKLVSHPFFFTTTQVA